MVPIATLSHLLKCISINSVSQIFSITVDISSQTLNDNVSST